MRHLGSVNWFFSSWGRFLGRQRFGRPTHERKLAAASLTAVTRQLSGSIASRRPSSRLVGLKYAVDRRRSAPISQTSRRNASRALSIAAQQLSAPCFRTVRCIRSARGYPPSKRLLPAKDARRQSDADQKHRRQDRDVRSVRGPRVADPDSLKQRSRAGERQSVGDCLPRGRQRVDRDEQAR